MKLVKMIKPIVEDLLLIAGMVFIAVALYRININAGLITTGVFLFSLAGLSGLIQQKNRDGGGE